MEKQCHRTIPAGEAAELAAYLDERGIDYYMECNDGLYASLEMFQAVDTAVAMGNAKDGLKALADYVTTDILEDGIYNAFYHFGLLR